MLYDVAVYAAVAAFMLIVYVGPEKVSGIQKLILAAIGCATVVIARIFTKVYKQVWRYGGIQSYIKLLVSDAIAFVVYYAVSLLLPFKGLLFSTSLAIACMDLLGALAIRMIYRYAYKCSDSSTPYGRFLARCYTILSGGNVKPDEHREVQRIKIAIVGCGKVGIGLAEDLLQSNNSSYVPRCFIDTDHNKIGREVHGLPVYPEAGGTFAELDRLGVQEVVVAIPSLDVDSRKKAYEYYKQAGYKVKVFDYPTMQNAVGKKRQMREFDIEELLFRKPLKVVGDRTREYYKDKVIMITGGGGSIGSELCRQIARMSPKSLIILDVSENGAYEIQQELRISYGDELDIHVEIVSVCNIDGLERVFREYEPQIILHAAAHKHVPLMEKNCIEAVENNVFGTYNLVNCVEKYRSERFIMVSTDKAVNPTNVMGATKRLCEMLVLSYSVGSSTAYSATRFGNVLGSAGSVIPLFKKQIANGGPVTVTDKRIVRYFMTIPEASQLVLVSGAMAHNGELFALDMGEPVKIYDLAENLIRLSGMEPGIDIEILETGLRPGEKLYEELLVKTEELDKTDNSMIFIERDTPLEKEVIRQKLDMLREAIDTKDDDNVKKALMLAVPTYKTPEEFNAAVIGK